MNITNGGVTFEMLSHMPLKTYMFLKKACEIVHLSRRMELVKDVNAAFNGGEQHSRNLVDLVRKLERQSLFKRKFGFSSETVGTISWESGETGWQDKLNAYR